MIVEKTYKSTMNSVSMKPLSADERMAVSAVAMLSVQGNNNRKRPCEDDPDAAGGLSGLGPHRKAARTDTAVPAQVVHEPNLSCSYRDFSGESDPDPLTPLTSPGRVPNFPAKMHSILSRPDLADVVAWMPHGRSWRVLKPREFEIRVIPTYFEHAKFSSFIRQANGWGFRRIAQGRDRNSYYHELFLRGLPHLCKKMKRPGVAEKKAADPEHEPDFYKISEKHPVPEKADDESILLQCTLQGGPKARMPIVSGQFSVGGMNANSLQKPVEAKSLEAKPVVRELMTRLTPKDQLSLNAFQQSISASEQQFGSHPVPSTTTAPAVMPLSSTAAPVNIFSPSSSSTQSKLSALAAANQLALMPNPHVAAAINASTAVSQFAAGFAAATAFSHQQFRSLLDTLAVNGQQPQQPPQPSSFAQNPFG